jgi:hypothetical protein
MKHRKVKPSFTTPGICMFVLYGLFLVSCATLSATDAANDEANLCRQVKQVWDAKLKMDFGIVWDHMVSDYQAQVPRDKFIAMANVGTASYTIKDVQITEPGARAIASVDCVLTMQGHRFPTTMTEDWRFEDREWKLDLTKSLQPFPTSKP